MGTRLNAWCLFQVLLLGLGISATAAVAEVSVNIQSLPTLAAPVEGAFVGSDGEVLIVAGGESEEGLSAHVSVLAADGARWQTSRLEVPIAHGVTATTADGMICLGGVDRSGPTTRVMRLRWDGAALLQEPLPELPTPRLEAAAAVLDGILYVTGGRPAVDARPDGALLALDLSAPETGWQSLEPNPSPRLQPMLVARAGAIYLMGGTGDSSEQNWSYRAKPFDGTITRGWVQIAAAPADLSDAIPLATGQSHICVLTTGAGQSSPDLLVYHTITDTWVSKGTWAGAEKGARYAAWQGGVAVADTAGDTIRRIQIDSTPAALHWLDYTAIGFYLVVLLGIGAYFAHGDGTSAGFFLGGRRIPW